MPKFYRQNRKKIDPRYFLNETINRDEDLEEAISSKFDGEILSMRVLNSLFTLYILLLLE